MNHSFWDRAQQEKIRQSIEKFKDTDPERYKKSMETFNEKLKYNQEIPDCVLEEGQSTINQFNKEVDQKLAELKNPQNKNIPHCPVCSSTNIQKISGASKVGKAALFGVFSLGSISKQFKCNSCGYKF
jgi:hypothetical protein